MDFKERFGQARFALVVLQHYTSVQHPSIGFILDLEQWFHLRNAALVYIYSNNYGSQINLQWIYRCHWQISVYAKESCWDLYPHNSFDLKLSKYEKITVRLHKIQTGLVLFCSANNNLCKKSGILHDSSSKKWAPPDRYEAFLNRESCEIYCDLIHFDMHIYVFL